MKQDYYLLGYQVSSERYIKVACHIVLMCYSYRIKHFVYVFVSGDPGRLCVQPLGYWDGGFVSLRGHEC